MHDNANKETELLEAKLAELMAERERMKAINKYFRLHGSMNGYPYKLTEEEQRHISVMLKNSTTKHEIYDITNISTAIHDTKEQLHALEKQCNL